MSIILFYIIIHGCCVFVFRDSVSHLRRRKGTSSSVSADQASTSVIHPLQTFTTERLGFKISDGVALGIIRPILQEPFVHCGCCGCGWEDLDGLCSVTLITTRRDTIMTRAEGKRMERMKKSAELMG